MHINSLLRAEPPASGSDRRDELVREEWLWSSFGLDVGADRGFDDGSLFDLSPADESPVAFDSTRERNLLPDLAADRLIQCDLCQVSFDGRHFAARGQGADIDHQDLASCQLLNLFVSYVDHDDNSSRSSSSRRKGKKKK